MNKKYFFRKKQHTTLLNVFDNELMQLQQRIGIDRTQRTYMRQKQIRNIVADFITEKMQVTDVALTDLTPTFIRDFAQWLSIRRHYRGGTIWLTCQQLKGIVSRAFHSGLISNNPFYTFHVKRNIRPRQYLTEQELRQVINLPITDPLVRRHRDLFIFSALTGMAFADICRLRATDIHTIDGQTWIVAQRQKTHSVFQVRLLPMAVKILHTYDQGHDPVFGPVCYRTLAKHIPLLIHACNIRKHITFHCARHSFAIAALSAGMPIESISRILGHCNLATTQIYARITTEKLAADMERLQTFCNKQADIKH